MATLLFAKAAGNAARPQADNMTSPDEVRINVENIRQQTVRIATETDTVKVEVVMLKGSTNFIHPLRTNRKTSAFLIKEHFQKVLGISIHSQTLIFNGAKCDNFSDLLLVDGSKLYMYSDLIDDVEKKPLLRQASSMIDGPPPAYDEMPSDNPPMKPNNSHSMIRQANGMPSSHFFARGISYQEVNKATPRRDMDDARRIFIRNVYLILSVQLAVTAGICAMFMFIDSWREAAIANYSLFIWIPFAFAIITMFAMCKYKNEAPINLILLMVFTVFESLTLGAVCALYEEAGWGYLVLEAFIITCGIFFSLTLFVLQSKIDFTWMGAGLQAALVGLIFWGFFVWLFGYTTSVWYCLFGIMLFVGFILYDTSMILTRLGPEDYVIAAMELYLDFINLFLYILSCLGSSSN